MSRSVSNRSTLLKRSTASDPSPYQVRPGAPISEFNTRSASEEAPILSAVSNSEVVDQACTLIAPSTTSNSEVTNAASSETK